LVAVAEVDATGVVEELGLNEGGDKMKKFVETLEGVRSKKVGGRDCESIWCYN
jgi:hypothetical protein